VVPHPRFRERRFVLEPLAEIAPDWHDPVSGLTMAELLIVIGVLAILMSILLPIMGKVREKGREIQCMSNLRQVHAGFLNFAADNGRRLPGSIADQADPNSDHHDWLMGDAHNFATAPQGGTIYKYIHSEAVYRCPSVEDVPPKPGAVFGPFHGNNGRFDFAAIEEFSGTRIESIPTTGRLLHSDGQYESVLTPLLVEKDATLINGAQLNGAQTSNFILSHRHHQGSHYAAIDGSVQWINEPQTMSGRRGCELWECLSPSGKWVNLGSIRARWGFWDTQ